MKSIPFLHESPPLPRTQVGGKAASLWQLVSNGVDVPPGFVLSTEFLAPWMEQLQRSPTWKDFSSVPSDQWQQLSSELINRGKDLRLSNEQRLALTDALDSLAQVASLESFAVRSSSPDEDLESASFAGGYLTCLGVRREGVEQAILRCFLSCLEDRVVAYKQQHGFDLDSPSIAIIIQAQIPSDVSGIAFSINPHNNDYDEAVINANWGLGESVVDGSTTPDEFVVDKRSLEIQQTTRGRKERSVWLNDEGGTTETLVERDARLTLGHAQIVELTKSVTQIEGIFHCPIDVEWAYTNGRLVILQARPITTFVPLPPEMVTSPGARRVLYNDIALSSGLTINGPISPLGLDWMRCCVTQLVSHCLGNRLPPTLPAESMWFFAGCRMYQNLSNVLWLATPKKLSRSSAASDALLAETLAAIDSDVYRTKERPRWAKWSMIGYLPVAIWKLRRFLWNFAWAILSPRRAARRFQKRRSEFHDEIRTKCESPKGIRDLTGELCRRNTAFLIDNTMSVLAAGMLGLGILSELFRKSPAEQKEKLELLKLGFPENVVSRMGIEMFRLTRLLSPEDFSNPENLATLIRQHAAPRQFQEAWDAFVSEFGCRGPSEMDIAKPRFADDESIAFQQMQAMAESGDDLSPERALEKGTATRQATYSELLPQTHPLKRPFFRWAYSLVVNFAGLRDTPKQVNLEYFLIVRRHMLAMGKQFVEEQRLDSAEQIFDFEFNDIETAQDDPSFDMRQCRSSRIGFHQRLSKQVSDFPAVIDSRGRILRPPPKQAGPGELIGTPISRGIARGRARLLHQPDEQAIQRGDILVAHTTDPGWTPLFVNAGAIVIEIGGVLQHGAVVAREYGKPCVAGIDSVMKRIEDGQLIEVNGTTGIVKILPRD